VIAIAKTPSLNASSRVVRTYRRLSDSGTSPGTYSTSYRPRTDLAGSWSYKAVKLDRDLAITTKGVANIVPDDLANMYQGLIDGVGNFDPWT
jgi:hypothetical protein